MTLGYLPSTPLTLHRTGGCYSEDQGLQSYWRSEHYTIHFQHKGSNHPGNKTPSDL